MKLKRYIAFAGANYYPSGGWDDLVGTFDDLDEAKTAAQPTDSGWTDWANVVDTETRVGLSWDRFRKEWV